MKRMLYRAQVRKGLQGQIQEAFRSVVPQLRTLIENEQLTAVSAHCLDDFIFIYYECTGVEIEPERMFEGVIPQLLPWPGMPEERFFILMPDIFHYNQPVSREHWERSRFDPETVPWVRISYIKPEKLSSYIFYHYQFQEEKPGEGDKYGMIGLHENMLCFYLEKPFTIEKAPFSGLLTTNNTPGKWKETMVPHFIPWPDPLPGQELWKETELIFSLR